MGEELNNHLKILVTGANGQLGRCIQDIAVHFPDYDIHFKSSSDLDITSKREINTLFAKEKYDYCINCAAYTAVDKAESDKENAFLVNAEGAKFIAQACKVYNTILIHISTDFVFDGTKDTPYTEDDLPNPINVYGASKLKGEQYVQDILENYFIIRTSWVYSKYGHNFVKTMLRLEAERNEINVVNDQIGSPTYAGDLAELIIRIINSKLLRYGLYHYSNEGVISWYGFAKAIFEIKGMRVKVNPISSGAYPTTANRPKNNNLSKTKTSKTFKMPIPFWIDSLKKCLGAI